MEKQNIPTEIEFRMIKPDPSLSEFVESFWMLKSRSDQARDVVVLPDGRIDLFFLTSPLQTPRILLVGLESEPQRNTILPGSTMFAVSFKLLAVEYVLDTSVASILNNVRELAPDFWNIEASLLENFDDFCKVVSRQIECLVQKGIDDRKRKLFKLLYSFNGALTVQEISEQVAWSRRQMNRYFQDRFGISLKAYSNILRFRASFPQIKDGKLFPEQNFTDQSHFIKEVKRYSGVAPGELNKNTDQRFIHFLLLPPT
ncbi:MAG: AraC family transcriptional regulator [Spirochaetia bacterium]|nr:AraC family transcriptional regulator [Spirochaetia bacterium]